MNKVITSCLIERVREIKPLIHNITNIVVANFTANGLLAFGAKPVMASAPEEVAEMTKAANALVLNMGTLNKEHFKAMLIAGKAANQVGNPVVLDPVGVGATHFRTNSALKLLQETNISFVRGNAAEIANLIGKEWKIRGVETGNNNGNVIELAIHAAKTLNTIVIVTGKDDISTDGTSTYLIHNGHSQLTKVTGTGCLLSAIVGAFAAVEENQLLAAASALTFYGIAAEIAAANTADQGPGSFQIEFINQLSKVTTKQLSQYGSIELI